jgi:hypothetical protein
MPQKKADQHHKTHLIWADVREIRRLRKEERVTYRRLGEIFHINADTARDICMHVTWQDDPEQPTTPPLAQSYGHH